MSFTEKCKRSLTPIFVFYIVYFCDYITIILHVKIIIFIIFVAGFKQLQSHTNVYTKYLLDCFCNSRQQNINM